MAVQKTKIHAVPLSVDSWKALHRSDEYVDMEVDELINEINYGLRNCAAKTFCIPIHKMYNIKKINIVMSKFRQVGWYIAIFKNHDSKQSNLLATLEFKC